MVEEAVKQAAAILSGAHHAIALTGAGISTPSGIPDFRSPGSGLWDHDDPMQVASIAGFKRNPAAFYAWITPLANKILDAQPNPAHTALAKLEISGTLKCVITQNIDMLHSLAGSRTIYELHGNIQEATCLGCGAVHVAEPLMREFLQNDSKKVPDCPQCGGVIKPNVVLFGELLPAAPLEAAKRESRQCDVMFIAGSSLEVYPAADLPRQALAAGAALIIINQERTLYDAKARVVINGDVADVIPQIVSEMEANAR